jgi:3-hydroxyisobutyrate dehydrogenase-like beta-hydroxyacid dehydrogenase
MRITVLGLGHMGAAMAGRLLAQGHTLVVYNRTPERAEPFRARGATVAASPGDAVAKAEVAVSMLADDAAVERVTFGPDGILAHLPKGAIHVSMSTISVPLATRLATEHARAGQRYASAPVFGRPEAAAEGKLFVIASGQADAVHDAQPVFDAIGQRTVVLGTDPAAAALIKLTGNFLLQTVVEGLAEAFAVVRKAGIDPQMFHDVLTSTLFNAPVYRTYGGLMVKGNDDVAGFTAPLALKDTRLMLAAADTLRVPMPFASVVRDAFVSALARGYERKDMSVLARVAAENAGLAPIVAAPADDTRRASAARSEMRM